jgi:ATP synthase protein I
MAAQRPPEDNNGREGADAALAKRLQKLGSKLGGAGFTRPASGDRSGEGNAQDADGGAKMGRALRLSGDFIGGIVVGAFLGWLFDRLTGFTPWGMIVFMLLGFAAGTMNAMRSARLISQQGISRDGSGN